ncbi:MAG TPA: phospholipase [Algoriphagus sp.]|jgi:NTE family protein|uniref:patatin-like phospholipase family protein n=1 Tax=unclassified Algoriphagus TaxID=2641541 RepID=UPI000C466D8F|nr:MULTISPECIES: patatin-like phospholipase family protein [unclassified Algoriphagus]MAL12162.1 phospholipase [Algoriphagus sp.]MAN86990.1 phospholipase [Algoriphagus sp.]QYH40447.1 phospholipase [Algoriphagus sp. NBT04N3]HAH39112.1 phospholipase [Algoriphagus sp.]HAS59623.1 phospholipase [Algoriphagus sp.]|tara:strand:+ start:23321 stop:24223 length:903 start_codon:yes stop_codon:yes gene_type:complete
MAKKKKVSLVLSSGGARGLAHVGVIEELEKRNYEIAEIAGCSAGALVGGMYAAGKMEDFKNWICNLDRIDVFSLMDFTFSSRGFIKGEKVFSALKNVVEDCQIEDLSLPFSCNAVEVHSGKEIIFNSGSLYTAIRASGSIPSVFVPAVVEKQILIDGGVLNPIPLSLIKKREDTILMIVDVNGLDQDYVAPPKKDAEGNRFITLPAWLREYKDKMSQFFPEEKPEDKEISYSTLNLVKRSFDLLQDRFCELLLEKHDVDIQVKVARKQAGTLEFHRSAELIEIGREKAQKALDDWEHGNQ